MTSISPVKFSACLHRRYDFNYKCHYSTHSLNRERVVRRLETKKKTEKWWKTPPEVSIVGFSRIRDKTYHASSKFLWFIAICVGVGLCGYQVWNSTKRYLEEPILKNVDIVRDSGVKFPSVYLCPGVTRNLINLAMRKDSENCSDIEDPKCRKNSYLQLGFKYFRVNFTSSDSVEKMWNMTFLNSSTVRVFKPCKPSDTNCKAEGKRLYVDTMVIKSFWGGCLVLNTVYDEEYRGPFSFIDLEIYNWIFEALFQLRLSAAKDETEKKNIRNAFDRTNVGALIYLNHEFKLGEHHHMFYTSHDLLQGFRTHVVIRKRVYDMTRGKKASCVDKDTSTTCYNQCVEANLSSVCRMPYSQRKGLKECSYNDDFFNVHLRNYKTYTTFNRHGCNCLPSCVETTFIATADAIDKMTDEEQMMWVKLYFADNIYELTTEKLAYGLCKFVSDIGSYGGFFLGFCILNILEFLEYFIYILSKKK